MDLETTDTALTSAADALIAAHQHAASFGDESLQDLIEAALLYVGRRLANEAEASTDARRPT